MFGYLSIDKSAPLGIRNYFKYSYCALCKSLEYYHGQKSRFLLSYDMVVLSLMFINKSDVDGNEKIRCLRNPKKYPTAFAMKTISDLSILLFREKIKDNLIDNQHTKISKLLFNIYKKTIKKVEKSNPELSRLVETEFNEFYNNQDTTDIESLSNGFSRIMIAIAKFIGINEHYLEILEYISKWVYFIDAVDDIEKDIKHKQFNPLINAAKNLDKTSLEYINVLISLFNTIYTPDFSLLNKDLINEAVLYHLMKYTIPQKTIKIIRGKRYE